MNIGDIYWLNPEKTVAHPYVIYKIEGELVWVCAITTNKNKLSMPKTIVLEPGEGNLEKESIIETYKQFCITKDQFTNYIGSLNQERIQQILNYII